MSPSTRTLDPSLVLRHGAHASPEEGLCVMEAAAYIAGEAHSDHPACVSPTIATFLRRWNDGLPDDATRTRLLTPLLPVILDTRADAATEQVRAYMAFDWLVREYTPAWLDGVPSLAPHAAALRALAPLVGPTTVDASAPVVHAARTAANATWDAAWAAARDATWVAARDAARDAARAALAPTVATLQASACDLVRRMAAVQP